MRSQLHFARRVEVMSHFGCHILADVQRFLAVGDLD